MRSAVGYLVVALALFVGGRVLFGASSLEQRTADAEQALLTLRYGDLDATYEALATEAADGAPLPRVSQAFVSSLQGAAVHDPLLAGQLPPARAGARRRRRPGRNRSADARAGRQRRVSHRPAHGRPGAAVKRIDDIVRAYTDVVRVKPGDEKAAWNLEFVSRVRAQFAQSRQPAFPEPETRGLAGDLPLGPTLHGAPGEPPPGADMKQFKVVVPMRPDERKQLPQGASEGEPRKKRG